ncbi:MAG TPA: response regulator [Woeseiaceae bacterium]|jgi:FixJ family two-component response regulator|nr:response regulator [Woeseiaceae bacterium]
MSEEQFVYIVDDDSDVRESLVILMETVGQAFKEYESAHAFLEDYHAGMRGCLVADIRMPRMSGLELQEKLIDAGSLLPIIFITGHGDISLAVKAMRRGALDFIRKPFHEQNLLDRINEALDIEDGKRKAQMDKQQLVERFDSLSQRELEVLELVAQGKMSKVVADDLGISERTVEAHRSHIMHKLGIHTVAQLIRLKIQIEMLSEPE